MSFRIHALPLAPFQPLFDLGRTFFDHAFSLQAAAAIEPVVALASLVAPTQLQVQRSTGAPVSSHVAVDALEADPELILLSKGVGDLLRAPLPP